MNKILGVFVFVLGISMAATAADPHAFPVPYVAKDDQSGQGIHFINLPTSGTIKVITVSGEEVRSLNISPGTLIRQWYPVSNSEGKPVATGVYFYLVDGDGQQNTGKLVVIR